MHIPCDTRMRMRAVARSLPRCRRAADRLGLCAALYAAMPIAVASLCFRLYCTTSSQSVLTGTLTRSQEQSSQHCIGAKHSLQHNTRRVYSTKFLRRQRTVSTVRKMSAMSTLSTLSTVRTMSTMSNLRAFALIRRRRCNLCALRHSGHSAPHYILRSGLSGHTGVPTQHASSQATNLGWGIVFSLIGAALLGATYAI
jgi:hypothetical protein